MFSNTLSRGRARISWRATGVLALAAALVCSGCRAPVQRIPIDVEPASALLFVDGAELPGLPTELSLRSDESHVLFFRGAGYLPQQIILESREQDGVHSLAPLEVRVRLAPLAPTQRDIIIEAED